MDDIKDYYEDLRNKAKISQNKDTLKFLQQRARNKLVELSGPFIKTSIKKRVSREYKRTMKVIRRRYSVL